MAMTQPTRKTGPVRIAVVGLGYVGLPVAVAFAEKFPGTVGFDISEHRIEALRAGEDPTGEIESEKLKRSGLKLTANPGDMRGADVFVICVPTPIHADTRPNLEPLQSASNTVGKVLRNGGIVVYESTVYPGLTEDFCGPILANVSGLQQGVDFKLGYSPERINPGDRQRTFDKITKIVAGEDEATAGFLAEIYGAVVTAGIHVAPSIKVAEMAKVLENTQRDLNIALMNELAIICDLMGMRTKDVLDAAGTKWNFLKFTPGLVGGHCIGVDPYYLTSKAESLGHHPEVMLAGRRINSSMGSFVARRLVRFLGEANRPLQQTRVGILGLTFKEDVSDIRNSRVPDIVIELRKFGIQALVCDPHVNGEEARHECGFDVTSMQQLSDLDALVLAVPHREFREAGNKLFAMLRPGGVILDVKSMFDARDVPGHLRYWSL
jgi:UDP-N-acetyl-D-galactosamine dehydrogenase